MASSISAKLCSSIPADWETRLINFSLSGPALAIVLKCDLEIQAFQGPFSPDAFMPAIHLAEAEAELDQNVAERFKLIRLGTEPYLVHTLRLDRSRIALIVYPFLTRLAQARTHALGLKSILEPAPLGDCLPSLDGLRLRAPSAAWQFALFDETEEPSQTWLEVF